MRKFVILRKNFVLDVGSFFGFTIVESQNFTDKSYFRDLKMA